jgi:hypothetical protein
MMKAIRTNNRVRILKGMRRLMSLCVCGTLCVRDECYVDGLQRKAEDGRKS